MRNHSWSFVVTRGHSWSFVVTRGHSCVLLDKTKVTLKTGGIIVTLLPQPGGYVIIWVCMHVCMCVCVYACVYVCMCVCLSVSTITQEIPIIFIRNFFNAFPIG
jgi:hypothetical protein